MTYLRVSILGLLITLAIASAAHPIYAQDKEKEKIEIKEEVIEEYLPSYGTNLKRLVQKAEKNLAIINKKLQKEEKKKKRKRN